MTLFDLHNFIFLGAGGAILQLQLLDKYQRTALQIEMNWSCPAAADYKFTSL
jgi:hypothetical protein